MAHGDGSAVVDVLIISDIRLHRESLTQCLAGFDQLRVVGDASTPHDALSLIEATAPNVILLDAATVGGLELACVLIERMPSLHIIAFGLHDGEKEVLACAEAGVTRCFPSDGSLADLAAAIVADRGDEVRCSPKVAAALFKRVSALSRQLRQNHDVLLPLTIRESEIIRLIEHGLSNKEIAQRLNIEVATVKNHVHSILEKLHVTSRQHAARLARAGVVQQIGQLAE